MNNVEYLKARIDLVVYVQSCVPSLHKEGRLFVACCPFHSEKHASFKVNPEMQIVTCFGACGKTWDLIAFAEAYHQTDFQGALEALAQYAGIELVSPIGKETHSHKRLYALLECAEQWFRFRLNPDVIDYLIKARGLTPETIANAGIGYAPNTWQSLYNWLTEQGYTDKEMLDAGVCGRSDKTDKLYDFFRGRVMIPMRDSKHRVVGFVGRAFDEGIEPRYKNSPQSEIFDKGRLIYTPTSRVKNGHSEALRTLVVVEGQMDAISALNRGFENVVASMGTSLSSDQIDLLCRGAVKKIVFCLDRDEAGRKALRSLTEKHVSRLALKGVSLYAMFAPHGKDPDDTFREMPHLWPPAVTAARTVVDVLIDLEMEKLGDHPTAAKVSAMVNELLPILKSDNPLIEDENIKTLADKTGIAFDRLKTWLAPQMRVMDKPAAAPKIESIPLPTTEEWVLHGILKYEADGWLYRANACLLLVYQDPMPYALAPLNGSDFTDSRLRRFFEVSVKSQAEGQMIRASIDAPLEATYQRIATLGEIGAALDIPFSYDIFIHHVYELRLKRLRKERPTFEGKDASKARECAIAIASLLMAQEELIEST